MQNIVVLIAVHNRLEITKRGLTNLYRSISFYTKKNENKFAIKILVIDDGSTDGTYEWISENYPEVYIARGDGNLWWSGSMNKGLEYASQNINSIKGYLSWNDDLIPAVDYFFQLDSIISNESSQPIIGSILLELKNQDKVHAYGAVFNKFTGLGKYKHKGEDLDQIREEKTKSDWLPGMGTYISKEIVDEVGKYNEHDFPQYFGDMDYSVRAAKKGHEMYAYKDLKLYNDVESTGLRRPKTLKELKEAFNSNRSKYNIKQNLTFAIKHGYFPLTLIGVSRNYFFFFKDFIKVVFNKHIGNYILF